ncbi:MAG: histidine ammonia-lyase [Actinomycetota bacterium]
MSEMVFIDGGPLTVDDVVSVARRDAEVKLAESAVFRMDASRAVVETAVAEGRVVYGVTTGFGALADVSVDPSDLEEMQHAVLRSHAAGVGPPLPEEVVRAMLLLRARTLATGYSGVRPELVRRLIEMLIRRVHPVVPEQGSVGASGDLAQLAHLALPLIGEGRAEFRGEISSGAETFRQAGLEPLRLSYKEGLALLNGTEGMLAVGCLALADAEMLARSADVACAMSVEALLSTDGPFDPRLHDLRPHPGQMASASNLRRLLEASEIVASHRDSAHAVQDAYSIRCAPQVHGAARDVVSFARGILERELSSVADNPVVIAETGDILSSGNFHGEPLGFALDFMAVALAEIGSISERRTDRLLDPERSRGLPPFLTERAGTNTGLMLSQYTQAALVAENRILSTPATVDTIPTSGSQEDHVSMGWNAALKLRRVVANVARILAVEALCAAQGMEFRAPLRGAAGTSAALMAVRQVVARVEADRELGPEIDRLAMDVVLGGTLVDRAGEATLGLA